MSERVYDAIATLVGSAGLGLMAGLIMAGLYLTMK